MSSIAQQHDCQVLSFNIIKFNQLQCVRIFHTYVYIHFYHIVVRSINCRRSSFECWKERGCMTVTNCKELILR